MPDSYNDEKGNLIIDFSSDDKGRKKNQERASYTEYSGMDLASGYPVDMIWVTKDGRRIAIPNMSDNHLLNTVAYLRRRSEEYKKMLAVRNLIKPVALSMLFENAPSFGDEQFDEWYNEAVEDARKMWDMPTEDFLSVYIPIYRKLKQEAYKRKILIEGHRTYNRKQLEDNSNAD